MISNNLPASTNGRDQRPFRARYIRIRFSSKKHDLDEARIIATLWGCITRRVRYSPFSTTPNDLTLNYQDCEGYFIPAHLDPEKRSFQR